MSTVSEQREPSSTSATDSLGPTTCLPFSPQPNTLQQPPLAALATPALTYNVEISMTEAEHGVPDGAVATFIRRSASSTGHGVDRTQTASMTCDAPSLSSHSSQGMTRDKPPSHKSTLQSHGLTSKPRTACLPQARSVETCLEQRANSGTSQPQFSQSVTFAKDRKVVAPSSGPTLPLNTLFEPDLLDQVGAQPRFALVNKNSYFGDNRDAIAEDSDRAAAVILRMFLSYLQVRASQCLLTTITFE